MPPARLSTVRPYVFLAIPVFLILASCGGGGGLVTNRDPGQVSGVVFDEDGDIVRNARVFIENPPTETFTNSSGAYVMEDVPARDVTVHAEVTQDGVEYVGQTVARVFENERTRSASITVFRKAFTGTLRGVVEDVNGFRVRGARIAAIGNTLASTMAISDDEGKFVLPRLGSGIDFLVSASGPEFRSDSVTIRLDDGEDRSIKLVLDQQTGVAQLSPPNNLDATAWTSPFEATRSDRAAQYEAIKRMIDKRRPEKTVTRTTVNGNFVEVDLFWDPVISNFLLGYGVYRANGSNGPLGALDFLRDPLAEFYADASDELQETNTYSYAVDSINTDSEEGPLSSRVVVETLGDLDLLTPDEGPVRFRWQAAAGAEQYIVYVFDREPNIGVTSIWNTEANPTTGTTQNYTGPALTSGHTYFYIVLGLANGTSSRTISRIDTFVPN